METLKVVIFATASALFVPGITLAAPGQNASPEPP